jgi:MoaA/NifB/PqqE/SkfB family radical SAM enzyme
LRPMYCDQPWSVIYMAWNGDVRTCCFNDYALGNIDHSTIEELWNGPKYHAMRKSVARGEVLDACRDCLNGKSNYSVVPKLEPSLLLTEIRSMFHRALL